jgi:hypothetical protein
MEFATYQYKSTPGEPQNPKTPKPLLILNFLKICNMDSRSKYSKHVYLLNKSVFSEKDSYYGSENIDFTREVDVTKQGNKSLYNDSQFPTEKKDFKSDVNPHILKRFDQKKDSVWFGTYMKYLSSSNTLTHVIII